MRLFVLALITFLSVLITPSRAAVDTNGEYILISGGVSLNVWEHWKAAPHDKWELNFVRAARIRIQQLQTENPGAQVTWLVYRPAYVSRSRQDGRDLFGIINSVRDAFKVKLVYFDRTQQLLDYLNSGRPRDSVKIVGLEYFGHSNKACFLFDYSNNIDSASKVWLHEDDLGKINRNDFSPNAYVKSWGCHTGESMSKKFRSATGITMIGARGKTEYQTDELPIISTIGGTWSR